MSSNRSVAYLLIVLILSLVLFSCDLNKADELMLLRTDSFSGPTAENVESWVLISDRRGKIIDYQNTSDTEGTFEFKGHTEGSITVTELKFISYENGNESLLSHQITSYAGVPIGNTYFVTASNNTGTPNPDPIGKAKISLNNYTESVDPWNAIGFSDGYQNDFNSWLDYDSHTYDGSTFKAYMNLREDPMDIFITSYKGSEPVYSWVRDVNVGDSVVVNFNDFNPMTTVIVNNSVDNAYIRGKNEPGISGRRTFLSWTEYWKHSKHSETGGNPKIGYIDGFDYYDVYVQIGPVLCCSPHKNVTYQKVGTSVPEFINLPAATFSLSEGNLYNLNYSFDRPYSRKSFYFSKEEASNSLWWFIHAPEDFDFVVPKIPEEIQAKYPFLINKELPLESARFVEYLDDYSFSDFFKSRMERNFNRDTFEELDYYFQF